MASQLASLLCIVLIAYFFWIDRKNNEGFSKALWIPTLFIIFARADSILVWLNIIPRDNSPMGSVIDGNPFNRRVYLVFIIIGIITLLKRKIDWRSLIYRNMWIWLYFFYALVSILWSDYPFVSFKRLIKASGVLIMAIIIASEVRPYLALGVVLKRLSFILLPISVLFIKYYPYLGRHYHFGEQLYRGVAAQKNGLGAICLISGIYFAWNLIYGQKAKNESNQQLHFSLYIIIIPMIIWLLVKSNSVTSLFCLLIATSIFLFARLSFFLHDSNRIIPLFLLGVSIFGILEAFLNVSGVVFMLFGRDANLTQRVFIWEYLLTLVSNPLIGTGYESFWLGNRLFIIQERWGPIVQSHNGYLEMYLNMGIIGVLFIICWFASGLKNTHHYFLVDYPAAILRFCLIVIIALYNYTEATFYGVSSTWMLLIISVLYIPANLVSKKNTIDKKIRNQVNSQPEKTFG